jgi:replicative DNA helicase
MDIKQQPNDQELEKNILGVLLLSPHTIPDVITKISYEFFYHLNHQVIYKTIVYLYDNTIAVDMVTVVNHLKQTNQLDIVGGPYAIVKLTNDVVSHVHIYDWISILQHYYLRYNYRSRINCKFIYHNRNRCSIK